MSTNRTEPLEILSAFLDGEEIEPSPLAEALAHPGAREALRDFALLRAEVQRDAGRPGPAFYDAVERALGGGAARRSWWRTLVPVPAPALAAAAVALMALLVWAGWSARGGPVPSPAERPPSPDRVVRFEPGVDWHVRG